MSLTDSEYQQLESAFNMLWYSMRRYYVDTFFLHESRDLNTQQPILDLGGHKTRKRGVFNIEEYNLVVYYANLTSNKGADFLTDAGKIATVDDAFGTVICAELLEHVSSPVIVLEEIYRVLQSDGKLLITVPFMYQIHADPSDYGRYTNYFWEEKLGQIGYKDIVIQKQGFFWSVLADMIRANIYYHSANNRPSLPIFRRSLNYLAISAKKFARHQDGKLTVQHNSFLNSFTTGFGITCRK